jgi:hypothetical protein
MFLTQSHTKCQEAPLTHEEWKQVIDKACGFTQMMVGKRRTISAVQCIFSTRPASLLVRTLTYRLYRAGMIQ